MKKLLITLICLNFFYSYSQNKTELKSSSAKNYIESLKTNKKDYKAKKACLKDFSKHDFIDLINYGLDSINLDTKKEAILLMGRIIEKHHQTFKGLTGQRKANPPSNFPHWDKLIEHAIQIFLFATQHPDASVKNIGISALKKVDGKYYTTNNHNQLLMYLEDLKSKPIELVKIAGAVKDDLLIEKLKLFRKEQNRYNPKFNWNVQLALAKQRDSDALNFLYKKLKNVPINDAFIYGTMQDILYTKHKRLYTIIIDAFLEENIQCRPTNPNISTQIDCAYNMLRFLAPVIKGIPIELRRSGSIKTRDHKKTLQKVRDWFKANPLYQIK
jgi:hypothetical protein